MPETFTDPVEHFKYGSIGSDAKGIDATCINGNDQRGAPRNSNACDAGAFEQGAVAPAVDSSAARWADARSRTWM